MSDSYAMLQRFRNRPPEASPKTRKELLWWIWENVDPEIEAFKCGPQWVVRIGKTEYATYVRCLQNTDFAWWKDCIEKRYFPF